MSALQKTVCWKDVSSFSQGETDRTPTSWQLCLGKITLVVHRHIHYQKDQWLLTCAPFFNLLVLSQKDAEHAKAEALRLVIESLSYVVAAAQLAESKEASNAK